MRGRGVVKCYFGPPRRLFNMEVGNNGFFTLVIPQQVSEEQKRLPCIKGLAGLPQQ
jgi:hypothetical protein